MGRAAIAQRSEGVHIVCDCFCRCFSAVVLRDGRAGTTASQRTGSSEPVRPGGKRSATAAQADRREALQRGAARVQTKANLIRWPVREVRGQ
jgi:hypothetical protein